MSNLQLFLATGLPTISVLIGILLSQRSTDKLEKRIDGFEQRTDTRFSRVESRLDRIEADLREFYRTIGQHEVRMDTLEKRGA
jgi:endonuclease III